MSHIALLCAACDSAGEIALDALSCSSCRGPVDVVYNGSSRAALEFSATEDALPGIWRWWRRLPLHKERDIISLGEGSTSCLRLERIGARLGLEHLYAKVEYASPTGSFKDRGTTVMLSMVRELGYSNVVDDSSGNAGASLSAYAARAGMRATVFVPASGSPYKMAQIGYYGADVRPTEGTREDVAVAARMYAEETGAYHASHNLSPYFLEGMKTFAYEAADQLPQPIQHIVMPVGSGSLLIGVHRAFDQMLRDGVARAIPRLHCVQALACMPIVAAWQGREWDASELRPTVAGGIIVDKPPRGHQVVEGIKASVGVAVAVEERDIVAWQRTLAQEEGLFVEPTSAATFAGLAAIVDQGTIQPDELTLLPLTGFGLKDRVPES